MSDTLPLLLPEGDRMAGLTIGSLFSGMGGLDRAAERVFGARTAWVSDIDKGACKVLAHRYPHAPNLGDITRVDWATVPRVDIITGGSPCQDLSHAGRRAGMTEGTRSNLWVAMREVIAIIRPSFVVWENVQGALSAEAASELEHCPGCMGGAGHGGPVLRALGRVLGDLADLGLDAEWVGLRASDLGACHRRFRVFVLAYAPEQRHERPWGARDGRPGLARATRGALTLLPTPRATRGGSTTETCYALSEQWRDAMAGALTRWGEYAEAIARHEQAWGVPAPDPTEPGPKGNPRLSAAFCEWMMMQPPGWITDTPGITRNEALKMLGNGVVTPQAAHALRVMLDRIGACMTTTDDARHAITGGES